jgi:GT2 family glycosyltransferase
MNIVVATVQRGRHAHLRHQRAALSRSTLQPSAHVVVSMDAAPIHVPGADVVKLEGHPPLPLARARNLAIDRAARAHAADLVVLLDVDCLPSPELLHHYASAYRARPGDLLAGPVHYLGRGVPQAGVLPTAEELRLHPPHPARPAPAPGELVAEPRMELFWSLSCAVAPGVHARIGGFDEAYEGYGAEDTDYARRAQRAGVGLTWVGGATAFHLFHPVSEPPVEHLHELMANAQRFYDRWHEWPMGGWLQQFAAEGLIVWEANGSRLELAP